MSGDMTTVIGLFADTYVKNDLMDICRACGIKGFAGKNLAPLAELVVRHFMNSPPANIQTKPTHSFISSECLEESFSDVELLTMCKFFPVKGYAGINKAQKAVILGEHFARFLHWNPTDKDPAAAPAANQGGQKNQAALPADAEIDPMAVDLVAATIMGAYNKDELAQICEAYDIPQKAGTHRARQIAAYFLKKPQFQGTGGNLELPILSPDELYTRFDGEEVLLLCQHLPVSGYSKLNKGERVSLLAGFFSLHVAQKGAKKPSPAKVAKQGVQSSAANATALEIKLPALYEALQGMMVDELKDICRSFTISGFAGKNKEAIIKLIIDRYASNSPPQPSMDILEDIYTIPMLKDLCKLFGVTKYANLNRPQLLDHFVRTMSGPLRITGAMGQVLNTATTAQSPVATPPKTTAAATNKSAATSAKKTAAGQTTAGNKRRADDSIESVAKKGKIEAKKLADLKKMENDLVPVIAKAAEYCRGETMPSNDAELGMQCALAGALKEMKKKGYRIFREPATKQLGIDNEVIENWIRPDFVLMTNQHSCYLVIEIKVKPKAYVSDKDEKQLKGYIASIGAAGFWETDMKTSKKWLPRQPFDDHHYETQADGKRPIWGRLICFGQDGSLMQKVYELDPATGKVIDRK